MKRQVEIVIGNFDDSLTDLIAELAKDVIGGEYEPIVKATGSGDQLLEIAKSGSGDIFILILNNIQFQASRSFEERLENSLKLVNEIKTIHGKPVISLSSFLEEPLATRAKMDPDFFLALPFKLPDLVKAIYGCLGDILL